MDDTNSDRGCHLCCDACRARAPSHGPSNVYHSLQNDPYAVKNLLPAGTITFPVSWDAAPCDHIHLEDDWHNFRSELVANNLLNAEDEVVCRHLRFLVQHNFLRAHCRLGQSRTRIYLRMFIIPYDLANVQGKLRVRNEVSIMRPARQSLRIVLPKIMQDQPDWDAEDRAPSSSTRKPFLDQRIDNRTLAEIYGDLPSPRISPSFSDHGRELMEQVISGQQIAGIRSELYQYQKETVAAMLEKELCTSDIPDPLYIPLVGMDRTVFYLQPATMEILRGWPLVGQGRGGILCEELGTGKTVMSLALILVTLDQLPEPEPSFHDLRPVTTPLAFLHFPYADDVVARKRMSHKQGNAKERGPFPTLVEHLLHYLRLHPDGLDLRQNEGLLESTTVARLLQRNVPFYFDYHDSLTEASRPQRKPRTLGPRVVYLTSATLVAVPNNLLGQWTSEIQKHCDSLVRVLVVKPQHELPRARVLASNYDIILMNHDSLAKEETKSDIQKSRSWDICKCPPYEDSRIPDCTCDIFPDVSPLFQIRWKRLVVDEGHVHGSDKNRISTVAQRLSVERRWLVSGTPTTNLLGLSFGSKSGIIEDECLDALNADTDIEMHDAMGASPSSPMVSRATSVEPSVARVWTMSDRNDLHRLERMIVHFLQVPQFAAVRSSFDAHVIQPLFGAGGPQPGAIQVLIQVMQSVMIRHRIEDVEKHIVLPPVHQETVLLDLHPLAVRSYNALQAAIAINAIDSERVDQDYLFHSSNVARLQQLMANISQLMFWHVDEKLFNVDELFKAAAGTMLRAVHRNVTAVDLELLKHAAKHIELAVEDTLWRSVQQYPFPEVPFFIADMPRAIFDSWSDLPGQPTESQISATGSGIMFPDRIVKLRNAVTEQPLITEERLVERGRELAEEERLRMLLWEEQIEKARKRAHVKDRTEDKREAVKAMDTARKAEAPEKELDMQRELRAGYEVVQGGETSPMVPRDPGRDEATRQAFLRASPLASARIACSASAKLDYLLQEVLKYSAAEKFLVFSKSPLTLAHVADGLSLARIRYLQYTTQVTLQQREQLVITFETSETYRVFLMELKHGSRGLNLTSASRVIFCEPVWQADVEAQAIKRAHRIGQTKPISVQTLAIRGTAEEAMMARRAELKDAAQSAAGVSMTDDFRMRHFIANPKFIDDETRTPVSLNVPFLDLGLRGESARTDAAAEGEEGAAAGPARAAAVIRDDQSLGRRVAFLEDPTVNPTVNATTESSENPRKRARTVRFVDAGA